MSQEIRREKLKEKERSRETLDREKGKTREKRGGKREKEGRRAGAWTVRRSCLEA
jgi:hypothetical protein